MLPSSFERMTWPRLLRKYNVGFVSAGGVVVVGGLFVIDVGCPGSLPLGAAEPAAPAGAAAPAVPMLIGFVDADEGDAGIAAGVVDGLVVVVMPLVAELPAALGVLAAGGGEVMEPVAPAAELAESLGEPESPPQLMAARSPVATSQSRLPMLTS
jgi:hypothetical protein